MKDCNSIPPHKPVLTKRYILGSSGRVVNSLDFCLALLKSSWLLLLLVRPFFAREGGDREFANFTMPTLKTFLEAHSKDVSGNKQ